MKSCVKCGTQLEDNVKFCPGCGTSTEMPKNQASTNNANNMSDVFMNIANTADTTDQFDKADIDGNKAMAILAYIGPLVLIPIFAAKDSKFARYHANQGLLLLIISVLYGIISGIISFVALAISWRLFFISGIFGFISLVLVVPLVLGIVNAASGKAKELPIIGKFRLLK